MNFLSFEKKLIPLDEWVQEFVNWLVLNHRDIFQAIKAPIELCLEGFEWLFTSLHPVVIIVLFAYAASRFVGKKTTVFTIVTLLLIGYLGLWEETMITLAMVISSVFFCAIVGIPLGIMSGRSDRFELFLRPALDAMQTIPPFVYLVPVVMLFSIGTVSGILATIVFALPPIVRLTSLGIRQVHPELIEAALAFARHRGRFYVKSSFRWLCPRSWPG
jgi:glycine betaine/proline transport system permease protein